MDTCKACGTILPFAGMKCPKCGFSKDGENAAQAGGPARPFNSEKHVLIMNLTKFRDLLSENEELQRMIKPQSEFPRTEEQVYKKRTLMKFFWPFLVGGIGAGIIIYFISMVIMFSTVYSAGTQSTLTQAQVDTYASHAVADVYGGYVVAIAVALAIIFLGLWLSRKKRDEFKSKTNNLLFIAVLDTPKSNKKS